MSVFLAVTIPSKGASQYLEGFHGLELPNIGFIRDHRGLLNVQVTRLNVKVLLGNDLLA